MNCRTGILLSTLSLLLFAQGAHAESETTNSQALRLSGGVNHVLNTEDDNRGNTDFQGRFNYFTVQLGYRFKFGTEPFASLGMGIVGKEGLVGSYGLGLRQRISLGQFEPYAEAGYFSVGDGANQPMTLSIGAGAEYAINERYHLGAGAGHYFSGDRESALDWYGRAYLAIGLF